jgi:hypothetical protein
MARGAWSALFYSNISRRKNLQVRGHANADRLTPILIQPTFRIPFVGILSPHARQPVDE